MYLNLRCVMRQWLCNALNKAADENSLAHQSFVVILRNSKTKQLHAQLPPILIHHSSQPNQDLTVYKKSENDLHIF